MKRFARVVVLLPVMLAVSMTGVTDYEASTDRTAPAVVQTQVIMHVVASAFGAAPLAAQEECWDCFLDGENCYWDGSMWVCESGETWCDEVDPETPDDGWEDCDHNQSKTYCDTGQYDECGPHFAFVPGTTTNGLVADLAMEFPCASAQVAPVEDRTRQGHGRVSTVAIGPGPR